MAADHHGRREPAAARGAADRDRLHPARRPQDLGGGADQARSQRRRTLGPVPVLRRSFEIRAEGADHSLRRQQGRVPAGAPGELRARARRVGRDPDESRLGDLGHQCRRALYLRDFVAVDLRHHHGRLVVEFEISVPRRASLGGADGQLRSLDRFRDHHRPALRGLAQSVERGRGSEHARSRQPDRIALG